MGKYQNCKRCKMPLGWMEDEGDVYCNSIECQAEKFGKQQGTAWGNWGKW